MDISNPHHEDCPKGDRGPKGDKGDTGNTGPRGPQGSSAGGLQLSGGTMTGALTLNADPTANLHAATKQYVDRSPTFTSRLLGVPENTTAKTIDGLRSGYQTISLAACFKLTNGKKVWLSLPPLVNGHAVYSQAVGNFPSWSVDGDPTSLTIMTWGGSYIENYHILYIDGP